MRRERQVLSRTREKERCYDSRGEAYFGIGGRQRARRHARTTACMHAFIRHACSTMHTLVPRAAQTMAQNHALWRCALWAGKLWHRVRAAARFRSPLTLIRYLPLRRVRLLSPLICSDVPASGIEGENSNPDPTRLAALFLSLSLSPHRRRQIREEIWFVKYNSHARRWARDESSKAIVSGSWFSLVLFYFTY